MSGGKEPVQIHEDISMAQFRLVGFDFGNTTMRDKHGLGSGQYLIQDFSNTTNTV